MSHGSLEQIGRFDAKYCFENPVVQLDRGLGEIDAVFGLVADLLMNALFLSNQAGSFDARCPCLSLFARLVQPK